MSLNNKVVSGLVVALVTWMTGVGCHEGGTRGSRHKSSERELSHTHEEKAAKHRSPVDTSRPVAQFSNNLDDQVTNNDFKVSLYPTAEETVFKIDIRYGGNEVHQEITMLPHSYYRRIVLKKGDGSGQCILGFVDMDGKFNEMKLITASGTSIGIKTLKEYYLSTQ